MVRRCLYLDNFALQQKQLSWLTHEFATTIRQYLIGETEECENAYKTADYFSSRMRLKRKSEWKVTSKSMTVKMNLFPEPVQGVNGPTISTAILEKMLPITGRLTKGALWCKALFPRRWQTSQLRQNALTALPTPTQ